MSTLLTDFTYEQLQYLYLMLEDKDRDIQERIDRVEQVFSSGSVKTDIINSLVESKEINNQWMTKVLEASLTVKMRDIVNSN